jgi:hypothetical protein
MRNIRLEADGRSAEIETPDGSGELADDVDLQEAILVNSGREKLRLPIADESTCCDGKDFHSSNCPKIR